MFESPWSDHSFSNFRDREKKEKLRGEGLARDRANAVQKNIVHGGVGRQKLRARRSGADGTWPCNAQTVDVGGCRLWVDDPPLVERSDPRFRTGALGCAGSVARHPTGGADMPKAALQYLAR